MLHDSRMSQRRIGSARGRLHAFVRNSEALYMSLVDERIAPCARGRSIVAPCHRRIHNNGFGRHGGAVSPIHREIDALCAYAIAEDGIMPSDPAIQLTRIGIDQQLVGIKPVAMLGLVGSVSSQAVQLPG